MKNFTFLTLEQVIGENRLEILDKEITIAKGSIISDFTILLGGSNAWGNIEWWTQTQTKKYDGSDTYYLINQRRDEIKYTVPYFTGYYVGSRPVISYSEIKDLCTNQKINEAGVLEVEYGEYPQSVVSDFLNDILEEKYEENKLTKTGKVYTICHDETNKKEFIEYEHKGERYIRIYQGFKGYQEDNPAGREWLSCGCIPSEDQHYWIKVEPIKWLIEEEKNIALSKVVLFTAVEYNTQKRPISFEESHIKKFMDEYFAKEIMTIKKEELTNRSIKVKDINVEKLQEMVTENETRLESDKKERPKIKRK